MCEGMDFLDESKISKENADSGLDNSSDSGNSYDLDILSISSSSSSESDTSSHSDNEYRLSVYNAESRTNQTDTSYPKNTSNYVENANIGTSRPNDFLDIHLERLMLTKLNDTLTKDNAKEVLGFYRTLLDGQSETVDFSIDSSSQKPNWLNEEKFKRGQKFARDHLFCINFAEMISLFILFAQKSSLGPLIFTGKSDTPFTAFNRYLGTVSKLISWYTDDIWSTKECEGRTNLVLVRGMHRTVYRNLSKTSKQDLSRKTTLGDPERTALWCPMRNLLVQDFQDSVPVLSWYPLIEEEIGRLVWVSQTDMSITQFGFVGLAVTFPKHFGIHLASNDDLDAFLHMWRGLGYLLGVKDKYNFCNGDLETVRRRTRYFLEIYAKQAFRDVTYDWEHMCRCMTAGISFYLPRVHFEPALLFLCQIIGIETPRLKKKMKLIHYFYFLLMKLVFYLMKYSTVLFWLNRGLHRVIRRAQMAPPEVRSEWENRQFEYMKQPGKCPVRQN